MKKFIAFTVENTWLVEAGMTVGWGNGYVAIPKGHSTYGKSHDELNDCILIHGGLTFSTKAEWCITDLFKRKFKEHKISGEYWLVGFDTAHFKDNKQSHDEAYIKRQTANLLKQLKQL